MSYIMPHLSRNERTQDAAGEAYDILRNEMIEALMTDPAVVVQTPGWKATKRATALDIVADHFAGQKGEASLHELLRIVGLCAQGKPGPELHLRAAAWIAARGDEFAEFHHEDLAYQMAEELGDD